MKKRMILSCLMSTAALLVACGGGSDGSASNAASSDSASGATSPTTQDPRPVEFKCPDGYKSIQVTKSSIPNATMTLVTDDGIATLTFKTPQDGVVRDGTICLGKPDPVPAGVKADYVYEIKSYGGFDNMVNRTLTLNFTTDVVPDPNPPVIEMASVSGEVVTYKPTIMGSIYSNRPNYSLAAAANFTGLYVVRLRQ
ncbi:hypothetical protein KEH56_35230 [Burkholderia cenocepacia]|uniref:hypothetical protein n=1 Tax=Burkholderia cenocepacia TaxID=95486 RepID=UPI001BAAE620|nr:hypothetical protein [Burkholderia cenocepacia]QUN44442.1 hypothetical protein KEH56_35230 [Burkholderia cenocepacia]QUO24095.1 hypothetical protein KEH57_10965 [Burkholderia cenocepacia]